MAPSCRTTPRRAHDLAIRPPVASGYVLRTGARSWSQAARVVVQVWGQGGWPTTGFPPAGAEPFFFGTYFPPEPWHGMPSFM
ncbi:hypothetical protein ADK96_37905, partial [Streptomyces sp. IGB124]